MKSKRIFLVAGGTGGHIFPAIAFGEWISRTHPDVSVDYICGSRPLEAEIYGAMNIKPLVLKLEGSPIAAPRGKKISRCVDLLRSFFDVGRLIKERKPDACVVFGGYISAPFLLRARTASVPVVAHEQNAYSGKTTRMAAKMGFTVASGWERCEPFQTSRYTPVGIPIRCFRSIDRKEAWRELELPGDRPDAPVLVIMSGSLGSAGAKDTARLLAADEKLAGWVFLAVDAKCEKVCKESENIYVLPRRWDASAFFSVADAAITRGGASTLAEVISAGMPSVSIPWRDATGDHQMKNSIEASKNPGHLIWDEKTEQIESLAEKISDLHRTFPTTDGNISENMYNDTEKICEKLWDVLISLTKGEVRIGGR